MSAVGQFISFVMFLALQGIMEHLPALQVLFDLLFS